MYSCNPVYTRLCVFTTFHIVTNGRLVTGYELPRLIYTIVTCISISPRCRAPISVRSVLYRPPLTASAHALSCAVRSAVRFGAVVSFHRGSCLRGAFSSAVGLFFIDMLILDYKVSLRLRPDYLSCNAQKRYQVRGRFIAPIISFPRSDKSFGSADNKA